jgi:8-oxo-dGTP pyrophosphatase MutT (NUDIX family)
MRTINKVALAVIQDKKILMARSRKNKAVFYTLGGKVEANESDIECLVREVKEEIGVEINIDSLIFLGSFQASAHDKIDTIINIKLYTGSLLGVPKPSGEVEEIAFFDSTIDKKHLTDLTERVFTFLKDKNYIA